MAKFAPVMIFLPLVISVLRAALAAPVECSVPSNETLQEQHSKLITNGGALLPGTSNMETISHEFVTRHHLYGDTTCPAEAASGIDDTVEDRSICPWYGELNHDPTRFPSVLVEGKCKCDNCINNNINHCEPVMYTFSVLQQTGECNNGYYVYEAREMEISVGCTCAQPRTAPSDPIGDDIPVLPF